MARQVKEPKSVKKRPGDPAVVRRGRWRVGCYVEEEAVSGAEVEGDELVKPKTHAQQSIGKSARGVFWGGPRCGKVIMSDNGPNSLTHSQFSFFWCGRGVCVCL